jgi:hypothetical protein
VRRIAETEESRKEEVRIKKETGCSISEVSAFAPRYGAQVRFDVKASTAA